VKINDNTPSPVGPQNTPNTQTLRVPQIAKLAGVHPVSVRRAIKRGDLKPIGSFRHLIVAKDAVQAWISGKKVAE
jgi:hypothetical protein